MALFASELKAEERLRSGLASGLWIEGHVCRNDKGQPAIRVLRKMTATGGGEWVELTQDNQT